MFRSLMKAVSCSHAECTDSVDEKRATRIPNQPSGRTYERVYVPHTVWPVTESNIFIVFAGTAEHGESSLKRKLAVKCISYEAVRL